MAFQRVLLSIPEEVTRLVNGVPVVQNSCRPRYGLTEAAREIHLLKTKMLHRRKFHASRARRIVGDFLFTKWRVDQRMEQCKEKNEVAEEKSKNEGK